MSQQPRHNIVGEIKHKMEQGYNVTYLHLWLAEKYNLSFSSRHFLIEGAKA